jgi:AcrR family transcriptional regulator
MTAVLKWSPPPELSGGHLQNYTEDTSVLSSESPEHVMNTTDTPVQSLPARPKRADARRNYEKVVTAARDAFAQDGASASLEEIARRAQVGIGTLYRHFPSRQALLEAVYVEEVQELCRSAADLAELPPWEALVGWLHRFVAYLATKQALAQELLNYFERDAELFQSSRAALYAAGGPLLERAQQARVVRTDTNLTEVIQMVGGIAKIPSSEPAQIDHILDMALDGLRYREPSA